MTVEFLPGDEAPDRPDEPAPDGAPRRPWRWVLAGSALCVAVIAWAVTRPTVSPSPHPRAPAHTAHAVRPAPECRTVPDCEVHTEVPVTIARLVRDYLPRGAGLRVRTVIEVDSLTHRDLLVERDVVAGLGSVSIYIRVQRGGPAGQEIVPDPPGVGSLLLHRINSGFVVRLQYLAPDDVPPTLSKLRALIGDRRIAAA